MMLARGIVSQVNGDSTGDQELAPRLMVDASVSYGRAVAVSTTRVTVA